MEDSLPDPELSGLPSDGQGEGKQGDRTHHMTRENPRILFLHYWGGGTAQELARALKAALATQGK